MIDVSNNAKISDSFRWGTTLRSCSDGFEGVLSADLKTFFSMVLLLCAATAPNTTKRVYELEGDSE